MENFKGHQRTMGRTTNLQPQWLIDFEKEQGDKLGILRGTIKIKRDEAFVESTFGSREHKLQLQAMVNAYDAVINLIEKALGGK